MTYLIYWINRLQDGKIVPDFQDCSSQKRRKYKFIIEYLIKMKSYSFLMAEKMI